MRAWGLHIPKWRIVFAKYRVPPVRYSKRNSIGGVLLRIVPGQNLLEVSGRTGSL